MISGSTLTCDVAHSAFLFLLAFNAFVHWLRLSWPAVTLSRMPKSQLIAMLYMQRPYSRLQREINFWFCPRGLGAHLHHIVPNMLTMFVYCLPGQDFHYLFVQPYGPGDTLADRLQRMAVQDWPVKLAEIMCQKQFSASHRPVCLHAEHPVLEEFSMSY